MSKPFDLPVLYETRLTICRSCPHYVPESKACGYLIEKTAKKGSLEHPAGIRNPRSRCPHPERFWYSIISRHPHVIFNYVNLTLEERHRFTQFGVKWLGPLNLVNFVITNMNRSPLEREPRRSTLLKAFEELDRTSNDYAFLSEEGLQVDYVKGYTF